MDYEGTTADSFRIGNSRYFILKLDADSNFVEADINGVLKRFAWLDDVHKAQQLDSTKHAWNLLGGFANKIPYQFSKDSTRFIDAPSNNKFLFFNDGWQWKWAWGPDTTTVVRTSFTVSTTAPLRIDGSASGNFSANRTLSLLYNSTHFAISSNQLAANDITATSTNGVTITSPFTLGGTVTINTPQDVRTTASPTFGQLTLSNAGTSTSNAVRADRTFTTTSPLSGGGNLTADRTLVLNYNTTNMKLTSNQLNTIQDIATTSSPTFYDLNLTNNFTVGAYVNSNLIPNYTDTYDLGSSTKLWRKGWLSEMEAILFAKNTITLLGGWFYVTKNAGVLVNDVNTSQTQIDFGTTLTTNDFIVFRNPGIVEYMQIGSLVSGTTYNVTRNKDGSGANAFVAGTPFAVLGYNGDGRIELNAYDTPRISILKQGTSYNAQTELIRIGDINGMPGYSSQTFGAYFGDASTYFKYDATNGAAIRGALYLTNGDNVSTVLSSKASQTDLNTLSGTVSTHTTQIAQNTSDISLKASQTDLNTLTGRVTTAESNITINANGISSEVTNRTNGDATLQSSITQTANSLTSEITNRTNGDATLQSSITQTANSLTSEITNRTNGDATLQSSITQTANSLTSEITNRTNGDATLQSQVTQSANNILFRVRKDSVISKINLSPESIDIAADRISISGSTTFASGYNPSTKIASGGAAADINNNTTTINGGKITTNTVTLSQLNFTPVQTSNVIASINSSSEGITVNGAKLTINSSTTFASGYDPTGKIASGGAATDVNSNTTTITGSKIRTGVIQSDNWGYSAGSYIDLVNGTLAFGGSNAPKFSVDNAGNMTSISGTIGGFTIVSTWLQDAAQKLVMNSASTSIYARPLTGLVKLVMLGQTNDGSSPGWTGHYGLGAIDNSNHFLFRLDDLVTSIAGWSFDYQRFYNISSATGFELSNATSKTVTTGFAVWNPTSPKMFIGNSTSYMDWNNTTSSTLTVAGDIVSSQFSSSSSLDRDAWILGTIIQSQYVRLAYTNGTSKTALELSPSSIWFRSNGGSGSIFGYVMMYLNGSSADFINLYGYNVPKCYGVTDSPSSTARRAGDSYFGTNGKYYVWNGSSWLQQN
jgi:hypothetical protein